MDRLHRRRPSPLFCGRGWRAAPGEGYPVADVTSDTPLTCAKTSCARLQPERSDRAPGDPGQNLLSIHLQHHIGFRAWQQINAGDTPPANTLSIVVCDG